MATTKAFFISETYLKDNSPLSGNIDIAELYPHAKTAEDIYIQEAIGQPLYDDLTTKIIADPLLASLPDELALMKIIRDALVWYTCYDAIPFIATKIRNIGVVQQSGDNLTNTDKPNEWALRKTCKDKGDFYLKRAQSYLCKNRTKFPVYKLCSCQTCCGELNPNRNSPTLGVDIAFDNNDYKHDNYDMRFLKRYYRNC